MLNEFGALLQELRGSYPLRDVAKKIGISHTYLRDLELGNKQKPSDDTLKKIATAYNYSYTQLWLKANIDEHHDILKDSEIGNAIRGFTGYDNELDAQIIELLKSTFESAQHSHDWDLKEQLLEELRAVFEHYDLAFNSKPTIDVIRKQKLIEEQKTKTIEITELLKNHERITYMGNSLSSNDCQSILKMLELMFRDHQ